MPPYKITHPDIAEPMACEATNPKAARAWAAKQFIITPLTTSEAFDLSRQGVDLVKVGRNGNG